MNTKTKTTKTETVVAAKTEAVQLYTTGKVPRNGLNEKTKHGKGGTAGTYAAVTKALQANDGKMSMPAIQALCKEQGDAGFAKYAVRNHWLVAVTA